MENLFDFFCLSFFVFLNVQKSLVKRTVVLLVLVVVLTLKNCEAAAMTTLCTLIFLSWQMMSRSTRPPDPWRPRKQSSSSRSSGQCWLPLNRQALELLLAPPPCLRFLLLLQIMKNSKVKTIFCSLFRLNESLVSERLRFGRFGPFLEIFFAQNLDFFFLKFHFFFFLLYIEKIGNVW